MTLEEANKRYSIVPVGNKMCVMETDPETREIRQLWAFADWTQKMVKEFVNVKTVDPITQEVTIERKEFAKWWLRHSQGKQYDRLVFAMPGSREVAGPNDFNGWQGFTVEPKKGDWSKNKRHILDIICGGNKEHFKWVMNWLAAMFQRPGQPGKTAIVLRGEQGIGKGWFANNIVGLCFGFQQYGHIMGAQQLTGEFNEHLSGKCFIFADESTWGGDPKAASKLKGLVTEDTVQIHRKFLKMTEEWSALHIIIASNNEWPIPIEPTDRRFTVFDVPSSKMQDLAYFEELKAELNDGGRAAMLWELIHETEVDWKATRVPLSTSAKIEVASLSLKPIEHWWLETLERGTTTNGQWPAEVAKRELHSLYMDFLDRHHRNREFNRRATETELGMFLRKFSPVTQRLMVNGTRERYFRIPPLEECRAAWVERFKWGADFKWDREDEVKIEHSKRRKKKPDVNDIPF